jgi:hypothetical protein
MRLVLSLAVVFLAGRLASEAAELRAGVARVDEDQ